MAEPKPEGERVERGETGVETSEAGFTELSLDLRSVNEKLQQYVSNEKHQEGQHKARVFKRLGFTIKNWQELAKQLVFDKEKATLKGTDQWGIRYEQTIEISTPEASGLGKREILTAWIVPTGTSEVKLVTVIPPKK